MSATVVGTAEIITVLVAAMDKAPALPVRYKALNVIAASINNEPVPAVVIGERGLMSEPMVILMVPMFNAETQFAMVTVLL